MEALVLKHSTGHQRVRIEDHRSPGEQVAAAAAAAASHSLLADHRGGAVVGLTTQTEQGRAHSAVPSAHVLTWKISKQDPMILEVATGVLAQGPEEPNLKPSRARIGNLRTKPSVSGSTSFASVQFEFWEPLLPIVSVFESSADFSQSSLRTTSKGHFSPAAASRGASSEATSSVVLHAITASGRLLALTLRPPSAAEAWSSSSSLSHLSARPPQGRTALLSLLSHQTVGSVAIGEGFAKLSGISCMVESSHLVLLGGNSGTVLCVARGGGWEERPWAEKRAQTLELKEASSRLWGIVARAKPAAAVIAIEVMTAGETLLALVVHADGAVRVWNVMQKQRLEGCQLAIPRGATKVQCSIRQLSPPEGIFNGIIISSSSSSSSSGAMPTSVVSLSLVLTYSTAPEGAAENMAMFSLHLLLDDLQRLACKIELREDIRRKLPIGQVGDVRVARGGEVWLLLAERRGDAEGQRREEEAAESREQQGGSGRCGVLCTASSRGAEEGGGGGESAGVAEVMLVEQQMAELLLLEEEGEVVVEGRGGRRDGQELSEARREGMESEGQGGRAPQRGAVEGTVKRRRLSAADSRWLSDAKIALSIQDPRGMFMDGLLQPCVLDESAMSEALDWHRQQRITAGQPVTARLAAAGQQQLREELIAIVESGSFLASYYADMALRDLSRKQKVALAWRLFALDYLARFKEANCPHSLLFDLKGCMVGILRHSGVVSVVRSLDLSEHLMLQHRHTAAASAASSTGGMSNGQSVEQEQLLGFMPWPLRLNSVESRDASALSHCLITLKQRLGSPLLAAAMHSLSSPPNSPELASHSNLFPALAHFLRDGRLLPLAGERGWGQDRAMQPTASYSTWASELKKQQQQEDHKQHRLFLCHLLSALSSLRATAGSWPLALDLIGTVLDSTAMEEDSHSISISSSALSPNSPLFISSQQGPPVCGSLPPTLLLLTLQQLLKGRAELALLLHLLLQFALTCSALLGLDLQDETRIRLDLLPCLHCRLHELATFRQLATQFAEPLAEETLPELSGLKLTEGRGQGAGSRELGEGGRRLLLGQSGEAADEVRGSGGQQRVKWAWAERSVVQLLLLESVEERQGRGREAEEAGEEAGKEAETWGDIFLKEGGELLRMLRCGREWSVQEEGREEESVAAATVEQRAVDLGLKLLERRQYHSLKEFLEAVERVSSLQRSLRSSSNDFNLAAMDCATTAIATDGGDDSDVGDDDEEDGGDGGSVLPAACIQLYETKQAARAFLLGIAYLACANVPPVSASLAASGKSLDNQQGAVVEAVRCFFRAAAGVGQEAASEGALGGLVDFLAAGSMKGGMKKSSEQVEGSVPAARKLQFFEAVMRLLERYSQLPSARQFAYAALEHVDAAFLGDDFSANGSMPGGDEAALLACEATKGRIWSNVFKFSLDEGLFEEAFCSIASNPDAISRHICLRRLVMVVAERGGQTGQFLCSTALPFGSSLQERVCQELLWMAQNSQVTGTRTPYSLLYAFHVERCDWKRAATAMYSYSQRVAAEAPNDLIFLQRQEHSMAAAINALRLLPTDDAWVTAVSSELNTADASLLHLKKRGRMDDQGEASEALPPGISVSSARRLRSSCAVSLLEVEKRHQLLIGRLQVAANTPTVVPPGPHVTPEKLIRQLVTAGCFAQALTITDIFFQGTELKKNLSFVFDSLACYCCQPPSPAPHLSPAQNLLAVGRGSAGSTWKPSSHPTAVAGLNNSHQGQGNLSPSSAWQFLKVELERWSKEHHELKEVVVRAILSADTRFQLPMWLVRMILQGKEERDGEVDPLSIPGIFALLRAYLDFNLLEDATLLGLQILNLWRAWGTQDVLRRKQYGRMWNGYVELDRLKRNLNDSSMSGSTPSTLMSLKTSFLRSLEEHMRQLHLDATFLHALA